MSDADEIRASSMAPVTPAHPRMQLHIPLPALLWLGLAFAYLLASSSGHRAVASGIVGVMVGAVIAASGRRFAGLLAGLLLAGGCIYWANSLFFVAYMPPLAAFAFMAFFFHRTLRPGTDPLITRVARKEHLVLPPEVASYTRTLTRIWAWCFVSLLLVALLLAPLLTMDIWSRWVHGLGYVVPGLLFIGEYIYRHRRFRAQPHGSLPSLVVNIVAVINEAAVNSAATGLPDGGRRAALNMLPLARYRAAADPVLLGPEGAMTAASFFTRVGKLAVELPEAPFVINLCETRAGFMLGFAAALIRGQTSLLPAGQSRGDWEQLLQQFPDAYLLGDSANAGANAKLVPATVRQFDLSTWLALATDECAALQIPQIDDAQAAVVMFTSGSTGCPSAHPKSWGQLCRGAAGLAAALPWREAPACAIVGSVPPQHMFGLETTVMLPWYMGAPVHTQRPLLAADLATVLARYPLPSWWMTTAVHMRAPLSANAQMAGLQGVVASTMSLPAALATAAESAWQVPVMEIYGSTETGSLALRRTASETAWLPMPGVSLWGQTDTTDSATDGAEEVTKNYWAGGPHVGSAVPLGDQLELLPDGRFLLGGRTSDLVKVGGKRASLAALNQSLCELPGVDDGVYFFPGEARQTAANDEANGAQRPVGFYVSKTLSTQQVVSMLRTRIDPVFLPRPLYRVAQLPRNANGKLPRAALTDLLGQCRSQKNTEEAAPRRAGALPMMVAADHPALAGHFPGDPIVPGVVILARVAEAIHARFPQIELGALLNARFHVPLKPARAFTIQVQLSGERVRFEVHADIGPEFAVAAMPTANVALIASGQWVCGAQLAADVPTIGQA